MPYVKIADLPEAVKKLPQHAQEIWMAAFNPAFEQYAGDEEKCAGTAWAAVKNSYEKNERDEWAAKAAGEIKIQAAARISAAVGCPPLRIPRLRWWGSCRFTAALVIET